MLVLTRKRGEEIVVGETRIKILHTGPNTAKLGITAPEDVRILRAEAAHIPLRPHVHPSDAKPV